MENWKKVLAEDLKAWREEKSWQLGKPVDGSGSVLRVPRTIVERFKEDCTWAEIEVKDSANRIVDFHALRHTTGYPSE